MPSKKSNEKKTKQLGMNYSTASNRLRRKVMFMLIQRLKLDECFQCKQLIVDVDDFSIEHKKPWLGEDTRLFWDLGNIAFSHKACNSAAARHYKRQGRTKYEHKIGNREEEDGHYPSRAWYDRGCRCDACKVVKKFSRRNHERNK
jgi:hypothetical protein